MPNTLLTATAVTREALRILHQKLNFVGNITREYDSSYAKTGAKTGDTLKIRLPNTYDVGTGAVVTPQDTSESSVSMTVGTQKHVAMAFNSAELALSIDDFSDRYIKPAVNKLAAVIEADAMTAMYKDVYQSIWAGASPATYNRVLDGRVLLNRALAPDEDRTASLNSLDMADVVKDTKTLFQDASSIGKQYRNGYVGQAAGFDFVENTLWTGHTRGAANTAYTTNTTGWANGQSTITVASGTGAMNVGDVFTIAGIKAAHPETGANTGVDQQFVVTAAFAGGAGTVSISPAIQVTGSKKNVVVANGSATAALTFAGTASATVGTSLLFQKGAFAFATADLPIYKDSDFTAREVFDGISMRIWRASDVINDRVITRLDVLYGFKTLRPELAVRLHNN